MILGIHSSKCITLCRIVVIIVPGAVVLQPLIQQCSSDLKAVDRTSTQTILVADDHELLALVVGRVSYVLLLLFLFVFISIPWHEVMRSDFFIPMFHLT